MIPRRRARMLPGLLAVLVAVAGSARAQAETTLARLADDAAAALLRAARGVPLELAVPEDRTGRGSGLAQDLHALIEARLPARVRPTGDERRVRVTSVLSEAPGRLVFSARLVAEPGARLLDVVSVSIPSDAGDLSLAAVPWPGASGAMTVVRQDVSAPLAAPVLDLAFLDDDRLVVLWPEEVGVYRWDEGALRLESRRPLTGPRAPVRTPGGLLAVSERERAFWAMTSRSPRAVLFAVEGERLVERGSADALPWPGSVTGLRYRTGTNLLEGTVEGLGSGPFVALDAAENGLAVTPDGVLLGAHEGGPDVHVGTALAVPRPGLLLTSTNAPPGEPDALVVLERRAPRAPVARLPVAGSVRALAARASGARSRIVAAIEHGPSATDLLALEVGWP